MRYWLGGAVVGGVLGGIVGFVIGLTAYAQTAWVAALEIGGPAGILSAIVGLCVVFPVVRIAERTSGRP